MSPAVPSSLGFRLRGAALVLCALTSSAAPVQGQADVVAEADSGPAVAALRDLVQVLRQEAAAGALPPPAAESAEQLWLEQQADLIRSDAELRILALRSGADCPTVAEVERVLVAREHRAFRRLEALRALARGTGEAVPAAALPPEAAEEPVPGEAGELRLRLSSEPEDPSENPTP